MAPRIKSADERIDVHTSVRIPVALRDAMHATCIKTGTSKSAFIREAIAEAVRKAGVVLDDELC